MGGQELKAQRQHSDEEYGKDEVPATQEARDGPSLVASADSSEIVSGELDDVIERTRAKNKRAQKKFREKQKAQKLELEQAKKELSTRLKDLQGEIDALQNQKRILEIALSRKIDPLDAMVSETKAPFFKHREI